MTFQKLRLAEPLAKAVKEAGYDLPTPIQASAIPHILAGRDVLGLAQTGTGKTAAFALPILQRLLEKPVEVVNGYRPHGARALILSPTRELAQQVLESFETYGRFARQRCAAVVGGVHQFAQAQALKAGVDILIATPGRLLDLMGQRLARLTFVEIVVLDEADRMLDIGFLPDIRRILAQIPDDRQTLLFSATMPPAIRSLAREVLRDPAQVQVAPLSSAAPLIEHWAHLVEPAEKPAALAKLLRAAGATRTLVFTRTKRGADKVARHLRQAGLRAAAMHGDKEQADRTRILAEFRAARTPILVATDIAARGLHVEEIAQVINYDLPHEPETYVHRVGRTGRAGARGTAISFCTPADRGQLHAIERLIQTRLKRGVLAESRRGGPDGSHAKKRASEAVSKSEPRPAGNRARRKPPVHRAAPRAEGHGTNQKTTSPRH